MAARKPGASANGKGDLVINFHVQVPLLDMHHLVVVGRKGESKVKFSVTLGIEHITVVET